MKVTEDDPPAAVTAMQAAQHEAGHAVAAAALGVPVISIELNRVTLSGHTEWGGLTVTGDTTADYDTIIALGGPAGEALFLNPTAPLFPTDCEYEWNAAAELLRGTVDDVDLDHAVELRWQSALSLARHHEPAIAAVASALLALPKGGLSPDTIAGLLAAATPQPDIARRPCP